MFNKCEALLLHIFSELIRGMDLAANLDKLHKERALGDAKHRKHVSTSLIIQWILYCPLIDILMLLRKNFLNFL